MPTFLQVLLKVCQQLHVLNVSCLTDLIKSTTGWCCDLYQNMFVLFFAGEVLDTGVIFPFGKNAKSEQAKNTVVDFVLRHR